MVAGMGSPNAMMAVQPSGGPRNSLSRRNSDVDVDVDAAAVRRDSFGGVASPGLSTAGGVYGLDDDLYGGTIRPVAFDDDDAGSSAFSLASAAAAAAATSAAVPRRRRQRRPAANVRCQRTLVFSVHLCSPNCSNQLDFKQRSVPKDN